MVDRDKEKKDEFKIRETDEGISEDEIRLRALRKEFLELVHSDNGIDYDLVFMTASDYGVIEDCTYDASILLEKDPVLRYLMESVCERYRANWEAFFPLPSEAERWLKNNPPFGVLVLEGAIIHAGLRLATRLGYKKRGFNREKCAFLMENGLMTEGEYASFLNLKEYAEEARTKLIMTDLPGDDISPCLTLYRRMAFELFGGDVEKN